MAKNDVYYVAREAEREIKTEHKDLIIELEAEFINERAFKVTFDKIV